MPSSTSTPPPERLYFLYQSFHSGRKLTACSLANQLQTSERTVKRYIKYMREQLHINISWDPSSRSYFCEQYSEHLPLLRVTGEEALSLALASKTFAAWQGSSLGNALESILNKLALIVGGAVSVPVTDMQQLLSVPNPDASESREFRWFASILEAIRQHRIVTILYQKPTNAAPETRQLWPLHLAQLEHHWAMICWDPRKQQPRKFLLSRMEALTISEQQFTPPTHFDLKEFLSTSFGLFTGEQIHTIRVRFSSTAAPYLRERKWHPSQTIETQPDGGVITSFTLNHLMDIQRWVLSWGIHAEVLEPESLRRELNHIAHHLSKTYR